MSKVISYLKGFGLVLLLVGGAAVLGNTIRSTEVHSYNGGAVPSESSTILITGNPVVLNKANDPDLAIEVHSPVLVRRVEMVQWKKEGNEAVMVFANHALPSFTLDGQTYSNPSFEPPLSSTVFLGKLALGNHSVPCSIELLHHLVLGDYTSPLALHTLTNLPVENGEFLGLVSNGSAYVTPSDDWAVGDYSVSYSYLNLSDLNQLSVVGKIKSGILIPLSGQSVSGEEMSIDAARRAVRILPILSYIILWMGIVLFSISILVKKKKLFS